MEDLVTGPDDRGQAPDTELLDRAYGVGTQAMAAPPVEANRRGLIVAMGIIQIVLGSIMAVVAVCTVAMAAVSLKGAPLVIAGLIYFIPAGNLLVTGVGSVRLVRWARFTTIVSAGVWLGLVVFGLAGAAVGMAAQRSTGKSEMLIVGLVMGIFFLFWLALPITLLIVYTRPSVRATFERGRTG